LKCIEYRQRDIALPEIASRRFADRFQRTAQVEQVVRDLERHAYVVAKPVHRIADPCRSVRCEGAKLAADRDQQRCFSADPPHVGAYALLHVKKIADLLHFSDAHLHHRARQDLVNFRIVQLGNDRKSLGIYVISGIHGDPVVPFGLDGQLPTAGLRIVYHIIMHKCRHVDQFQRHSDFLQRFQRIISEFAR
jgi:hypothetical protein